MKGSALTRFYLPSSGSAPLTSLGFGATGNTWDKTSEANRLPMSTTKTSTALTTITPAGNGADPSNVCVRQYQSAPIAAQTISGTAMGVVRTRQPLASDNFCAQIVIKIVSGDGTTERGVAFAFNNAALTNEFSSTPTSMGFPRESFALNGEALTNVTAQAGDRIIIEIGFRQTSTSTQTASFLFGDDNASDYGTAATDTTQKNPWIEFSQNITFNGGGGGSPTEGRRGVLRLKRTPMSIG